MADHLVGKSVEMRPDVIVCENDVLALGAIDALRHRLLAQWRDSGVYVEALLPIHDELLVEADEKWADAIEAGIEAEMAAALDGFECRCPILAEGKVMDRWIKG